MFEKNLSVEEKYELLKDILILGFFLVFAFLVNSGIKISAYYMDDLYLWSFYKEQNIFEYVLPFSGVVRFRPIYWFVSYIQMALIGKNLDLLVPMNILFSVFIVSILYFYIKAITKTRIVAFIIGILFLVSRFSYYNISQLYGTMEALALCFLIFIIFNLYIYLQSKKTKYFYKAVMYYILISFTHERFMVFLAIFFFVLFATKTKKILTYISILLAFIFIQVLRFIFIGSILPAGTGGTNVVDTFTIKDFIKNLIEEIAYLFHINLGPVHLNGIQYINLSITLKVFIISSLVFLFLYILFYIFIIIKGAVNKNKIYKEIINNLFFVACIGACLVSSAVTIRVEMRWIYSAYLCSLIYLSYMYLRIKYYISDRIDNKFLLPILLLSLYAVLILPFEIYAHTQYKNIYLFINQNRYNSLIDVTYKKYGKDFLNKKVYIIGNDFLMSEFTKNTIFKVYGDDKNLEINYVDTISDLPIIKDDIIVLKENIEYNIFEDITGIMRELKLRNIYGYYRDTWTEQKAKIELLSAKEGKVFFDIKYPANLEGNEVLKIKINDEIYEFNIKENETYIELDTLKNSLLTVELESNFYVKDAKEKRGEHNLSYLLDVDVR